MKRSTRWALAIGGGLVFLLLLAIGGLLWLLREPDVRARVKVTTGSDHCHYVNLPGVWWSIDPTTTRKGSLNRVFQTDGADGMEFRKPVTPESTIYFAGRTNRGDAIELGPYSKEKCALDLQTGRLSEVPTDAWSAAKPIPHVWREHLSAFNDENDQKNAFYHGREFKRTGEHLSYANLSSNDRWLAVCSYDGKQRQPSKSAGGTAGILGRAPTKHPATGKLFVDVYDVKSGQKVLALAGEFAYQPAADWFLAAYFLDDRYFVFRTDNPVFGQSRAFWFCELPGDDAK